MDWSAILLIVFEGIDRAGKTTQAALLHRSFISDGVDAIVTGPFLTEYGRQVRSLYLSAEALHPSTEVFLLASSVTQLVSKVINRADPRSVILLDRYVYSTHVYHGVIRGLGIEFTQSVCALASQGVEPDLVIVIDVPVNIARARIADEADRLEQMSDDYHEAARQAYLQLARSDSRFVIVDGTCQISTVHDHIWQTVQQRRRIGDV